ncbi:MAG: DNA-formamidopyrimidine glycosylase family protein [Planctomycetota bacterium]|jgi:formamidopyrimidine-DNA glycosylase
MPELPDILLYQAKLRERLCGLELLQASVSGPSLLRTVDPPIDSLHGRVVKDVHRAGKRIVLEFDEAYFAILHLMIAGRFRWLKPDARPPMKITAAVFQFSDGKLVVTEAGKKKRASLHIVRGREAVTDHDPAGIDGLSADLETFRKAVTGVNKTLKRMLADPGIFDGIGNAYSDEILHAARLSPFRTSSQLTDEEIRRLHEATAHTLRHWIDVLRAQFRNKFPGPGDITAFRDDFAVHGRYGKPCPECRCKVERVRFAENEWNYCPGCQTQGKILSDRSLSRILK